MGWKNQSGKIVWYCYHQWVAFGRLGGNVQKLSLNWKNYQQTDTNQSFKLKLKWKLQYKSTKETCISKAFDHIELK